MNFRSSFSCVRVAGLLSVLSLSIGACDSSEAKKAEPVKADADIKPAEPAKIEPVKTEPVAPVVVADAKAADPVVPVVPVVPADAAAGDTKVADAADSKPEDSKPADTKVASKPTPKPAADKTPAIDGKPLYDSKCKVCHAADGKGTEAMKKNNVPDMSDKAWQGKHSKAVVVRAISNGIDGTKMKSFKDKLKPEEIDAVAAYVKKLK